MSDTFQAGKVAYTQQEALSELVGRLQQGLPLEPWYANPVKAQMVDDLSGALNYWAAQPTLPVVVATEFVDGAPRYVFTATDDQIVAIPFTIKPPPYPQTSMFSASAAEYGTGGTGFARAAISRTAGDMIGLGSVISGSNATIDLDALVVGYGLFYYNHRMEPGHGPRGTGFSVNFTR